MPGTVLGSEGQWGDPDLHPQGVEAGGKPEFEGKAPGKCIGIGDSRLGTQENAPSLFPATVHVCVSYRGAKLPSIN